MDYWFIFFWLKVIQPRYLSYTCEGFEFSMTELYREFFNHRLSEPQGSLYFHV